MKSLYKVERQVKGVVVGQAQDSSESETAQRTDMVVVAESVFLSFSTDINDIFLIKRKLLFSHIISRTSSDGDLIFPFLRLTFRSSLLSSLNSSSIQPFEIILKQSISLQLI